MAHFAQLNDSNIVLAINVIADADCVDGASESEAVGITFCKSLWGADTIWKQTSFNGTIRKQFAVVGGSYDPTRNEFVGLSPWASWVLNATNDWTAPLVKPDGNYEWIETAYQADNTTGWEEYTVPS
jgi:hypothetical protein|tara:strand:- start:1622 stop:2002 length:381 start_codon:yes stop_codon:yes gene_type:complete